MSWLTEIIPNHCSHCDKRLFTGEEMLCLACWHEVNPQLLSWVETEKIKFKLQQRIDIEAIWCCAKFTQANWLQAVIHKLKYGNHPSWSGRLIRHYSESIKLNLADCSFDAIIGTPIHASRRRMRGYNQVDAMGEALSEILQVPYDTTWLKRTHNRKSQTRKNKLFRERSTQNVFAIDQQLQVNYQHILLIDDVITTGSTLIACCRALQEFQPIRISILCLGQTTE